MGEKRGERQLVADNTEGTMMNIFFFLNERRYFIQKQSSSLFPLPSSETDQGGEAVDMTPALNPFPTQQVHWGTLGKKTWEEVMEKKGGKGVIRKSPLGGLNWVEGAQNQNYAATHTHTHHALRLKSPNVTQRKETWQVKHQGAEKVYRLHPLSPACALLHCILRGRPLQDSNTLFSTKIDTYPGASSCTNKKIINNNNFFKKVGRGWCRFQTQTKGNLRTPRRSKWEESKLRACS